MSTKVTPALQRVLGELQTVRARIDRQIAAIRSLIRSTGKQRTVKTARRRALVGYARDRKTLFKQKRARKRM
jgi:DNA-binding winged helix-turn-helix (wHTH) protein